MEGGGGVEIAVLAGRLANALASRRMQPAAWQHATNDVLTYHGGNFFFKWSGSRVF